MWRHSLIPASMAPASRGPVQPHISTATSPSPIATPTPIRIPSIVGTVQTPAATTARRTPPVTWVPREPDASRGYARSRAVLPAMQTATVCPRTAARSSSARAIAGRARRLGPLHRPVPVAHATLAPGAWRRFAPLACPGRLATPPPGGANSGLGEAQLHPLPIALHLNPGAQPVVVPGVQLVTQMLPLHPRCWAHAEVVPGLQVPLPLQWPATVTMPLPQLPPHGVVFE